MASPAKVSIKTDSGETVQAVAPVIVSASRSTDIPAFFPDWFMERLQRGYAVWINPFNQRPQYVSFEKTKAIVFWTKNPKPMLRHLDELDARGLHYYFQVTLNDYEAEGLEPHVAPLAERIETFKTLSKRIGAGRVIWRFDPVLFTGHLTPREIIRRIFAISKELKGYTNKLVFSFVDVAAYRKVQNNLAKCPALQAEGITKDNVTGVEPSSEQIKEFSDLLARMHAWWLERGWDLQISTCAEAADLRDLGIQHNHCIDGDLLLSEFGNDKEFASFLTGDSGSASEDLFAPSGATAGKKVIAIHKDAGQRKECGCIESKDIGMYNTCVHGCLYCYANSSPEIALKNFKRHKACPHSESIWVKDAQN